MADPKTFHKLGEWQQYYAECVKKGQPPDVSYNSEYRIWYLRRGNEDRLYEYDKNRRRMKKLTWENESGRDYYKAGDVIFATEQSPGTMKVWLRDYIPSADQPAMIPHVAKNAGLLDMNERPMTATTKYVAVAVMVPTATAKGFTEGMNIPQASGTKLAVISA